METAKSVEEWVELFKKEIADEPVLIFAKGEKNAAMCGFSHRVMEIFNRVGAPYEVRNIFADANIREAICTHTNWPTIPQIFIGGKFVGGCDIVTEMFENGDLERLLQEAKTKSS